MLELVIPAHCARGMTQAPRNRQAKAKTVLQTLVPFLASNSTKEL